MASAPDALSDAPGKELRGKNMRFNRDT